MDTKLVLRVMSEAGVMLGWAEVQAHARGDGALWVEYTVGIPIEAAGRATQMLTHWCDVNVALTIPLPVPVDVKPGDTVTLDAPYRALICGPAAGGLPPVTVRAPVVVAPPAGRLGTLGVR